MDGVAAMPLCHPTFSKEIGGTRCGHAIQRSGHHSLVEFEKQNNLNGDLHVKEKLFVFDNISLLSFFLNYAN